MKNIWRDITVNSGIINLSSEPITAKEVAFLFNKEVPMLDKVADYNMLSVRGYNKNYWYSKSEVIAAIEEYKNL